MDDDVLEQGPREPRRGALTLVGAACVVALALVALVRLGGQDDEPAPPPATVRPPGTPAALPWPIAEGACGDGVELPLVSATQLRERTGLQVLVGGARLTRIDVDSGRSDVIAGGRTLGLTTVGKDIYATGEHGCRPATVTILRVPASGPPRRAEPPGPTDTVVAGPAGVWGVDYRSDAEATVLQGLAGEAVQLAEDVNPFGVSASGVVATKEEELASDTTIMLFSLRTGEVVRTIGRGTPWAVGDDMVLWTGRDCRYVPGSEMPPRPCLLRATALTPDAKDATYGMPVGRVPAGWATLSPDGRYAAFQLGRQRPETRYTHQHPLPESDIAVLDLHTGELQLVPGLLLAPKSGAGLAFSPDGRWLVIATNLGDHGDLLVWRRGSDHLFRAPVFLAGPLTGSVPVVVTG